MIGRTIEHNMGLRPGSVPQGRVQTLSMTDATGESLRSLGEERTTPRGKPTWLAS
jgi:hypothetical protein